MLLALNVALPVRRCRAVVCGRRWLGDAARALAGIVAGLLAAAGVRRPLGVCTLWRGVVTPTAPPPATALTEA